MNWKMFNKVNNVMGWLVFAIASLVYLLTMEPTASLWDCAEFIACDYRLEVGHPPGAPFYMLVYNAITHLAPDVTQVALYANATSALLSGLTILFLFWTITHMLRRLVVPSFRRPSGSARLEPEAISLGQGVAILGSALVGSLVYTFTDTFWFSAVEAEVYAFSSLCTALVFWLMFQWDERSESLSADRWIVLIAYLMGLSIGVHLLNLLCLPAMALIYYYRRCELPTLRGAIGAVLISFVLIALMMYGIVQGLPKMAGVYDQLFVNSFGFSFNSGLYAYIATLFAVLAWSVYESYESVAGGKPVGIRLLLSVFLSIVLMGIPTMAGGPWAGGVISGIIGGCLLYFKDKLSARFMHVMQMSLLAIAVGFSSYGVILVRAVADTPMNENAPSNAFSLRYYLAREQYGSAPLIYGPHFAARPTKLVEGKEIFGRAPKSSPEDPDRYTKLQDQPSYEYADADKMLFPRIYSRQHAEAYNSWIGRAENDMTSPTFADNLRYFFGYQVNYMYWRYFLWNFVGRQNDVQGHGDLLKGNAITGIPFIDEWLVGPQEDMPSILKDNKGRNVYYALPFLLGLLGIFYQVSRSDAPRHRNGKVGTCIGHQSFWITFFLFFMTGLAIVLYLNQTPGQPRERDYAYAGSFYAFAIWIGIGVMGLWRILARTKLSEGITASLAVLLGLFVPLQMASQNWDDHDRSGRTIARDIGNNYLESVEPNAILFCYGDNDTFPLWYMQDVEGVRRDVRTVNLSYLSGDWYIDQMRRKVYEGDPIPMKRMTPNFYYYNEIAYLEESQERKDLDTALLGLSQTGQDGSEAILRGTLFSLPVDSAMQAQRLASDPQLAQRVLPRMDINLQRRYIDRGTATALDIINANEWKRPIYWTSTSPQNVFDNQSHYQVQTGMAFQLLPIAQGDEADERYGKMPKVRIEQMYDNVMNKFRYGGADNPKVYMDETARNMLEGLRGNVFAPLAQALLDTGDTVRAKEVLTRCLESIRPETVPYSYYSLRLVQTLYNAGMIAEADAITKDVLERALGTLNWMLRLSESKLSRVLNDNSLYYEYETAMMTYRLARMAGSQVARPYEAQLNQLARMLGGEGHDVQDSAGESARTAEAETE